MTDALRFQGLFKQSLSCLAARTLQHPELISGRSVLPCICQRNKGDTPCTYMCMTPGSYSVHADDPKTAKCRKASRSAMTRCSATPPPRVHYPERSRTIHRLQYRPRRQREHWMQLQTVYVWQTTVFRGQPASSSDHQHPAMTQQKSNRHRLQCRCSRPPPGQFWTLLAHAQSSFSGRRSGRPV